MIISFENNEEELMNFVLSALEIGRKTYKVEDRIFTVIGSKYGKGIQQRTDI